MPDRPINATFAKFGWPDTKIAELDHWGVMLRPAQPTLGALVLICKQKVTAFSDVNADGYAQLRHAIQAIERMLQRTIGYERINYLMLMMEDFDVHFHVLPRYEGARSFGELAILDKGWPGKPDLGHVSVLDKRQQSALVTRLRENWMM